MGICVKCIYCGDSKEPKKFKCNNEFHRRRLIDPRMFGEDFFCTNQNNIEIDFITGKEYFGSCRSKNAFEECPFFDDGSIALFAWSNAELTVFTKTEKPEKDTPYYDNKGIELGTITNIVSLYAWKNGDVIVYTLTPTPSKDYDIFDINGNKIGIITSVDDNTITVNSESDIMTFNDEDINEEPVEDTPSEDTPSETPIGDSIVYSRDEDLDFINAGIEVSSKSCYRDINKDTSYIPEEETTEDNTDDTPNDEPSNTPENNTENNPESSEGSDDPNTETSPDEPPSDTDDDPDLPDELPDDINPIAP